MSSHEARIRDGWEDPAIKVPLPAEVDEEWCGQFNGDYGYRGKRTTINAQVCLLEAVPGSKNFYVYTFPNTPPAGISFNGEVIAARMVPFLDEDYRVFEFIPHVAMKRVIDLDGHHIVADSEDEVWVPLTDNGDELVLY